MNMFRTLMVVLLGLFMVSGAYAADPGACAGCHGADGNSANPQWPKLAGQHPNYLAKQLADFKAGKRKDPIMQGQAAALSDADMAELGKFFASKKTSAGAADKKLVALGEKIYRGGNKTSGVAACAACHGQSGAGNPGAKFPALSHQHATYVEKALNDFKSGARANDAGKMMRMIATKMTDAEIKAVASYIQGLH